MGSGEWLQLHWFDLAQSLGIIGGLVFTAISLRVDLKFRRVSNLLEFTAHHRDIWSNLLERPELSRILQKKVNVRTRPVSQQEELFVLFIIHHLSAMQEAVKKGLLTPPEGLPRDIQWFFNLTIPKHIWEKMKPLQDEDFVAFVESWTSR